MQHRAGNQLRFAAELKLGDKKHQTGGHELSIEFAPKSKSNVALSGVGIYMADKFAVCMDKEACLHIFESPGGLELRHNNKLLKACLQQRMQLLTADQLRTCNKWVQCIKKAGSSRDKEFRALLKAADLAEQPEEVHQPVPKGETTADCIDPRTEDPLSWHCDCYEEMMERCRALRKKTTSSVSQAACISAQFCEHPRVCSAWKKEVCHSGEIPGLRRALNLHTALLARSVATSRSLEEQGSVKDNVDSTAKRKTCS
eukprot:gnl/TRDRNA2_/TRDRNA2_173436_c2_seq1.p1 gnl/TRDRNA2_/TRDRNA2_173436_c2~~gnl/TRDRNA2_/TRDRNA2_173436_c2_seq1.p1  ORF type:complete len:257 (-),score=40.80 gnl/TRDRNA2_/TRDRNA2_173436_c2_seq1:306-1076(-)